MVELIKFININTETPRNDEQYHDFLVKLKTNTGYQYEVAEWHNPYIYDWNLEGRPPHEMPHFNVEFKSYPREVIGWKRIYED